jgi:hypothetical protein
MNSITLQHRHGANQNLRDAHDLPFNEAGRRRITYGRIELTVALKPHDPHTGNVVPAQSVPIQQSQPAVAATRRDWQLDET